MRVGYLGFGLIGGSIARALRESGFGSSQRAWSPTGSGLRQAVIDGVLDDVGASVGEAVEGADIVVLAAPPLACLDLLDELATRHRAQLGPDTIVTDVASTKAAICHRATGHNLRFVGGHPMAGREVTGYAAGDAALFRDRPWIVVPGAAAEHDIASVERMALATGAWPARMAADAHDAATAAVSHLPLIVATALVEAVAGDAAQDDAPDWPVVAQLVATGWRDTTRLARGDPEMAAGIVTTNAAPLTARVRAMRDCLDEWLAELERPGGPDADRLRRRFAAARDVLREGDR
jgi:prephenate dehydrogenase